MVDQTDDNRKEEISRDLVKNDPAVVLEAAIAAARRHRAGIAGESQKGQITQDSREESGNVHAHPSVKRQSRAKPAGDCFNTEEPPARRSDTAFGVGFEFV